MSYEDENKTVQVKGYTATRKKKATQIFQYGKSYTQYLRKTVDMTGVMPG